MNTSSDQLCKNWLDAYFMRKKPAPAQQKRWQDDYSILEYDDTKVRLYNSGMITFTGTIKNAAVAVARYFLNTEFFSSEIINYSCIKVSLKKNEKYTIFWLGSGVIPEDICPEPKYWEEFKTEFEKYCGLKAFL
jgi:hypothetical protein